jgi:hypothetical protein
MTRKRGSHERDLEANTPAQQDEADVVAEVEAERDEDLEELVTSEDQIRKVGAVDAESVRENRRLNNIVNKKRANVKNVPFNAGDLLTKYETLIKFWPANTIDISVKRLTGSPVQQLITSRPRSGAELFDALKAVHGQHEEAKYEINFFDNNSKEFRGKGQITMPDMRAPSQQGQPMQYPPPYAAPAYPPPGYPGGGYPVHPPPPGYPPAAPAAPASQPPQPPIVVQPSAGPDMSAMLASFQQMFGMFQEMQRQMAAQQPNPQPPQQPPQPFFVPPPQGADVNTMMASFQQMFDMFRSMQPAAAASSAVAQPSQPAQPMMPSMMAAAMGVPPVTPPPGTMWVPGFGFVPLDRLLQAVGMGSAASASNPGPGSGPGPYRSQYRPYYPHGEQSGQPHPYYPSREPSPQQAQRGHADHLREALSVVRSAVDAVQDIQEILPSMRTEQFEPSAGDEDDSPVRVVDTGPAKIVFNKEDGTLRGWETGLANMDKLMKWVGEQRDAIQQARGNQQRQQPQQLPPGYVEVTPGYQPPPGYVAVPVDQQQPLPLPPEHMPPPIQSPPPAGRRPWEISSIPTEGEG